jgi:HSP20 family protein
MIMELMKWNPMKDWVSHRSRFDDLFDSFFSPVRSQAESDMLSWHPVVDVYENDDLIVVQAELPGVDKEHISVDVQGRVLTLKGERSSDQEIKKEHFYRRERSQGRFERLFTLPEDVNPDAIKAEYKDGLLKIRVPKSEARKPKQITVQ